MESGLAWGAFVGALVGALVAGAVVGFIVKRALVRRLDALDARGSASVAALPSGHDGDRFAEIAPELVTLARTATDSAIRREEVHEWHQPDLFAQSEDDIAQTVRAKVRRASFNVAVSRSALHGALRRHAASLPASLADELAAFADRLEPNGDGSPAERKRRLAADLDALESRVREALAASARG
jgi:hypothetical protein